MRGGLRLPTCAFCSIASNVTLPTPIADAVVAPDGGLHCRSTGE
jgi:hypothetical protein